MQKVPLMFQFLPTIEMKASGGFVLWAWFLSIIPVRIICKKCKLLHPDIPFITFMNFFFLFLVSWPCRQKRRRKLRGNKFMYNENKNNNIVTTSECNRSKSSITNIKQLFPSRTNDECLLELKKNPSVYRTYLNWPDKWKSRFLEFMEGKKSLPLTYDPFFKKLSE